MQALRMPDRVAWVVFAAILVAAIAIDGSSGGAEQLRASEISNPVHTGRDISGAQPSIVRPMPTPGVTIANEGRDGGSNCSDALSLSKTERLWGAIKSMANRMAIASGARSELGAGGSADPASNQAQSEDFSSCTWFHRREEKDGRCARACLDPQIGPCPRAVVTLFGSLKEGTCEDFPEALGDLVVRAGPCGLITFDLFGR
jgi:hypothetical protein